jgi:signal recognition particle receptor subunit beta
VRGGVSRDCQQTSYQRLHSGSLGNDRLRSEKAAATLWRVAFDRVREHIPRLVGCLQGRDGIYMDHSWTILSTLGILGSPRIPVLKVLVMGRTGSGKTSLIRSLSYGRYVPAAASSGTPEIADVDMDIDVGQDSPIRVRLALTEVSGVIMLPTILREMCRDAKGAVLVVDGSDPGGLDDVELHLSDVFKAVGEIPIILALAKTDGDGPSAIPPEELTSITALYGTVAFPVSAASGRAVAAPFEELARRILSDDEHFY